MSERDKEAKIVICPGCEIRMVRQSEVVILTSFMREPSGRVSFGLTDDIPARVYICPTCHNIRLYYDASARHAYTTHER